MLYPEVYNKVITEVRNAFPDKSIRISYAEVKSKLKYLEVVLLESSRLIPVAANVLVRGINHGSTEKSIEIDGYQIPKGVRNNYIALQTIPTQSSHSDS